MQIHDELVWQCRTELLGVYLPKIKRLMEYPLYFPDISQPLIIPAELKTGPDWLNTTLWKG
jgi:DNA polymerase I-like protein with 3'-5' exonuclease and polymerase domains